MDFYHSAEPFGIQKALGTFSVAKRFTLIFVTAFLSQEFLLHIRFHNSAHGV